MGYRRIPQSAVEFMRTICGVPDRWRTDLFPSDPDDLVYQTRAVFWRADGPNRLATVEDKHGHLLVCFAPNIHSFELDSLHEGMNGRSWREVLKGEGWCRPEHLALVDTLCFMFPPRPLRLTGIDADKEAELPDRLASARSIDEDGGPSKA